MIITYRVDRERLTGMMRFKHNRRKREPAKKSSGKRMGQGRGNRKWRGSELQHRGLWGYSKRAGPGVSGKEATAGDEGSGEERK